MPLDFFCTSRLRKNIYVTCLVRTSHQLMHLRCLFLFMHPPCQKRRKQMQTSPAAVSSYYFYLASAKRQNIHIFTTGVSGKDETALSHVQTKSLSDIGKDVFTRGKTSRWQQQFSVWAWRKPSLIWESQWHPQCDIWNNLRRCNCSEHFLKSFRILSSLTHLLKYREIGLTGKWVSVIARNLNLMGFEIHTWMV